MKKYFTLLIAIAFLPSIAFAATHTYSCDDLRVGGAFICNDDGSGHAVVTLSGPGSSVQDQDPGTDLPHYPLGNGIWNLVFSSDSSGGGTTWVTGSADGPTVNWNGGGKYVIVADPSADPTTTQLIITSVDFSGNLSNICVDDDGTSCGESSGSIMSGISTIMSTADAGFASTTGFGVVVMTQWAGDTLIRLFIGSGLAVLYSLRYWIVAIAIISAIVFFSFRAYRFFKH